MEKYSNNKKEKKTVIVKRKCKKVTSFFSKNMQKPLKSLHENKKAIY